MKIVSSFIDDIHLKEGQYHAFTFESSYLLKTFKQHVFAFFNNKSQTETQFLRILDSNNNEYKAKDFHFISFNCHHINLEFEKDTKIQIQKLLFHQLENNPNLINNFYDFKNHLSTFVTGLELTDGNLSVEFQHNEKTILNLIKSLEIIIEFDEKEYIPNYSIRQFLINTLLKLNHTGKKPILFISYPEADIGFGEIDHVINLLQELQITTIVLSSNYSFLKVASDNQLYLVNKNGSFYDILGLRNELKAFEIISESSSKELVRFIALYDFHKEYDLLSEKVKDFLLSDTL